MDPRANLVKRGLIMKADPDGNLAKTGEEAKSRPGPPLGRVSFKNEWPVQTRREHSHASSRSKSDAGRWCA